MLAVHVLGELQQHELAKFAAARDELIEQYGRVRFAMIMDSFAASERQINRAWSAAADEVVDEVVDCLAAAQLRLAETQDRLNQ